ncbi:MAG: glycosyltransferase family 2 protein [Eubacteriales bacterium]
MKKISYIIPCYCSANTLPNVVNEIVQVMNTLESYTYEIILVNDDSPDDTMTTIVDLTKQYPWIIGINLARNFGQHAALMAGFRAVTGDYVVCLDDDGQTPADEVYKLIRKIEDGYDAVYARYQHKRHTLFRNFGSYVNELMARALLGKPKELYISSYFAVKRFIVDHIVQYENSYPYVIGLVLRTTKKVTNVDVEHRDRMSGTSGYTIHKLLSLWFNGFTAFSIKPLRIATVSGGIFAIMGFTYGFYTIVKKFINPLVPLGFSSTMAAILFIGGVLMLMLGLIGEYIGRIYMSLNRAPQYVVREIIQNGNERTDERRD